MQKAYPVIYKARVVLECATPLMLATGRADSVFDVEIVRDANGLPTLTGTAIAGVLRHLCADVYGDAQTVDDWFGFQQRDQGKTSRVHCSFGQAHNGNNHPVEGLLTAIGDDEVLALLTQPQPIVRDHVRLTDRGVAQDTAKFDRTVLPSGTRFTFELSFHAPEQEAENWQRLLNLLAHPRFRLGGATRAGYGAFKVVEVQQACFDLRTAEGRTTFAQLPRRFDKASKVLKTLFLNDQFEQGVGITLKLEAEDAWRIGSGNTAFVTSEKDADALILSESRIVWANGNGEVKAAQWVVPGSGIKGALAHRTLYHWHRLTGKYAEDVAQDGLLPAIQRGSFGEAVTELFGDVREQNETLADGSTQAFARVGHVYFKDTYPKTNKANVTQRMHNSIDRFTGGTRDGVLFCEEVIEGGSLELQIFVDTTNTAAVPAEARQALKAAIDDLCSGRLGLGAGSGKGLGYFSGEAVWSDNGQWVNQAQTSEGQ